MSKQPREEQELDLEEALGAHSHTGVAGHAEEILEESALIAYHLFEDPTYFLAWGLKGKPFYLACVGRLVVP